MSGDRAIHQLVAGYSQRDAISNEARLLRDIFRGWGFRSEIICELPTTLPELRADPVDLSQAGTLVQDDDIVILHLSIGCEANHVFRGLKGHKVIRYHNVTPSKYFRAVHEPVARQLDKGREEVAMLAGVADLNLAVSQYNASELEDLGYADVRVHPLVLKLSQIQENPSRRVLRKFDDGKLTVLFVGRCAPNKCIEDLLHTFYFLQKFVEPDCRLVHVGSHAGVEQYHALLQSIVRDLDLQDVELVGSVPESELAAYYQLADVFLCMSEHEGFGIPLLEAMQAQVPVVAYKSAAVPETLDGSGIMFTEKHFDEVAEMIGKLKHDAAFYDAVVAAQNQRIARYENQDLEHQLRELLGRWL